MNWFEFNCKITEVYEDAEIKQLRFNKEDDEKEDDEDLN
jgi:hypothetical protein